MIRVQYAEAGLSRQCSRVSCRLIPHSLTPCQNNIFVEKKPLYLVTQHL